MSRIVTRSYLPRSRNHPGRTLQGAWTLHVGKIPQKYSLYTHTRRYECIFTFLCLPRPYNSGRSTENTESGSLSQTLQKVLASHYGMGPDQARIIIKILRRRILCTLVNQIPFSIKQYHGAHAVSPSCPWIRGSLPQCPQDTWTCSSTKLGFVSWINSQVALSTSMQ